MHVLSFECQAVALKLDFADSKESHSSNNVFVFWTRPFLKKKTLCIYVNSHTSLHSTSVFPKYINRAF